MNIPPAILDLRVVSSTSRPIRLWLPLFLLWPIVLVLALLAIVLTALADVVLMLVGQPYHRYTLLLVRSLGVLTETRGMVIRIRNATSAVDLTVK